MSLIELFLRQNVHMRREYVNVGDVRYRVLNREMAEAYFDNEPYVMISVKEPEDTDAVFTSDPNRIDLLRLDFHDFADPKYDGVSLYVNDASKGKVKLIQPNQAKDIVNFYKYHRQQGIKNFVIHCAAGISRSAGIAVGLGHLENYNGEIFYQVFIPNSYVVNSILKEITNENSN